MEFVLESKQSSAELIRVSVRPEGRNDNKQLMRIITNTPPWKPLSKHHEAIFCGRDRAIGGQDATS